MNASERVPLPRTYIVDGRVHDDRERHWSERNHGFVDPWTALRIAFDIVMAGVAYMRQCTR